ncbi:hypothetical protein [Neorhizobium sp. SOG26]|uniref:hypothetical protein n=1 Tax=Neorhizobium sp. SOG26 TaxID=2060726 RepID=UPI0012375CD2|nr:hypothetical protein [Neorhizobium sp. SOG26]
MIRSSLGMFAGICVSAVLGLVYAPTAAQAQFDIRGGGYIERYNGDEYAQAPDYREFRRERHSERRYGRAGCTPRQALAAASRWLDDPQIRRVYRSYYDIDGYGKRGGNRGRPDGVRISTAPDCARSVPR